MMLLNLKRDQARSIESFFQLMLLFAKTKMNDAGKLSDEYLSAKVLYTILCDVHRIFQRKLLSDANKFSFKFNDAQGITLYKFLMNHPIRTEDIWLNNLRNHTCEILYNQIFKV